jgi:hypothetical protein
MVEYVAFAGRWCWRIAKLGSPADFRIHPIGADDELDGHGPIAADCCRWIA